MMRLFVLLLSFCALVAQRQAFAALGGGFDAPPATHAVVRSLVQSAQPVDKGSYSVHTLNESGSEIREYATKDGTVFAIAWSGVSHPNFSKYFGRDWLEYDANQKYEAPKKSRRYQRTKTQNIVLETGGHMRAVTGRVYVPALLPEGVSLEEIQ